MWRKYLSNSCVFSASHGKKDSALWTDMLHIKDIYISGRKMAVGDGELIFGVTPGVGLLHSRTNFKIFLIFAMSKI
jgi:hypothetical protein